jgi:UDP-glucose:(heptosyl)LPS alpha-1,3-glucosyltransferase
MERQLAELAQGLLRRGYAVTVVARTCELPADPSLTWIRVPVPSRPFPLAYIAFFLVGSYLVARHRQGLVHTTGAVVFNRAAISTVHFLHHAFVKSGDLRMRRSTRLYRLNARVSTAVSLLGERWCYRPTRTWSLVSVSRGVAREIEREFPRMRDTVETIPNGVALAEFQVTKETTNQVRQRLGLDGNTLVGLFVGGDWERKGLRFAIEATAQVPGWVLSVAGRGDEARYKAMASALGAADRVFFLGHTRDTASLYAAADAFILPTSYEAFPLVSLEAAAAGLPLLITRVNGVEEIVREGVNGWFIDRNAGVVADRLKRLGDAEVRERMGSAARDAVAQLDWDHMVDKYVEHYSRIAGGPPRLSAGAGPQA